LGPAIPRGLYEEVEEEEEGFLRESCGMRAPGRDVSVSSFLIFIASGKKREEITQVNSLAYLGKQEAMSRVGVA